MSMRSFGARRGKDIGLSILFVLGGILIIFQSAFVLPMAAFAQPAISSQAAVGKNQALDLASTAVVRLLVTYSPQKTNSSIKAPTVTPTATLSNVGSPNGATAVQCTGLGVVIRSWQPKNNTELNNWVLTDGTLLNQLISCGTGASGQVDLSSIEFLSNDTYTSQPLGQITCQPLPQSCSGSNPPNKWCPAVCSHNLALVAFHSINENPYIDLTKDDQSAPLGIELKNSAGALPMVAQASQAANFLTPSALNLSPSLSSIDAAQSEAGMPVINGKGELIGMHLQGDSTIRKSGDISLLLPALGLPPVQPNNLQNNWIRGVNAFYAHRKQDAQQAFQQIRGETNNRVKGATQFLQLLAAPTLPSSGTTTPSPSDQSGNLLGFPLLLWICGGVIVLLLLILLLVTQTIGRKGARRRRERNKELERFKSEEEEAERRANQEVQRRGEWPSAPLPVVKQLSPQPVVANNHATGAEPNQTMMRCPHCNQLVAADVAYCPNCRYMLSPSASGLRLRALPPSGHPDAAEAPTRPMPPAPAYVGQSAPSISDQPTVLFPPLGEQPTVEMPQKDGSADRTLVPTTKMTPNRLLGLAAGFRTDPGIKRKHRPNEDSIFAMQGKRISNSQMLQYGFFVVADGMGGHANGQDASRLAIQTLINFMLPKLAQNQDLSADAYESLLIEGVQCANQAVHDQNQREHGDMGTTITTSLVIGSTAFVANVGDSRTYLYREGEGLSKVTHDHSVVASLVDAGIIKPDDIYTHPKRNQIYRSLGEKPVVEIDPFRVSLQPGDKLALCSDGLWDMTRDPLIEKVVRQPMPPAQLAEGLVQLALDGGGEDNVSVIVVQAIEASKRTGKAGMQILIKPDTTTLPDLPS